MAKINPGPVPPHEITTFASMEICADTRYLEIVGDFVRKNALIAGFSGEEARSIELSIDELVSNSIMHGYQYSSDGIITIKAGVISEGIILFIEERGKEFNPFDLSKPDLDVPLCERKIGGLGLYIVTQIMDEIYFETFSDKLKRFTLIKRIGSKKGGTHNAGN